MKSGRISATGVAMILIVAAVVAIFLYAAARAPAVAPPVPTPVTPSAPTPIPPSGEQPGGDVIAGAASVESIELRMLESFPVQVSVTAIGYLPDPCTHISGTQQTMEGDTLYLKIMTSRQADVMCIQVVAPFEETYPLDVAGLPAGTYTVDVNGVTGTLTLDVDNVLPPAATPMTLSWPEAEKMILSGDVQQVAQTHALVVYLTLKDGREFVTKEPSIDEVFRLVERCGEKCAGIALATE